MSTTSSIKKRVYKLTVHGPEFHHGEELIINPEEFPELEIDDIVEIKQLDREHVPILLQIVSLEPVKGKLQLSILKDIAAQFHLEAFREVVVKKIDPQSAIVDFIELSFKDQFISRADIWRFKIAMGGKAVYSGKNLTLLGIRAQVKTMLMNGQNVSCGIVGNDTKLILRSRSSRIFWLVQMSTEMWEYDEQTGVLNYESFLNEFIQVLLNKWTEASVSHSLTIILFSRNYYDRSQFPVDFNPLDPMFTEHAYHGYGPGCKAPNFTEGYGPAIRIDSQQRLYEDFYQVVIQDKTAFDRSQLLQTLKMEFVKYFKTNRWCLPGERIPASYEIKTITDNSGKMKRIVEWKTLPYGTPSRAISGNMLEAINVTLNMLDKHYMDRDLNKTGQSIVMVTAGCGVYQVDQKLSRITKQRMMDNGIGMDMVSLATPPLHTVPLFIYDRVNDSDNYDEESPSVYNIPHWISISFTTVTDSFRPLPSYRMFDIESSNNAQQFPVVLSSLLAQQDTCYDCCSHEGEIDDADPVILEDSLIRSLIIKDSIEEEEITYDDLMNYDKTVFRLPQQQLQDEKLRRRGLLSRSSYERTRSNGTPDNTGASKETKMSKSVSNNSGMELSRSFEHRRGFKKIVTTASPPNTAAPNSFLRTKSSELSDRVNEILSDEMSPNDQSHPSSYERSPNRSRLTPYFAGRMRHTSTTVNPFVLFTPESESRIKLTSNRRRWSHLFPTTTKQKTFHSSPNWKSLTMPGVLPLTSDFYPHPNDLHGMYSESFYTLTLSLQTSDKSVPMYRSHDELLTEMVCQRLAQDFQLVTTQANTTLDGRSIIYHLSMGHRIHKIIYDEELQTIEIKRYVKRHAAEDSKPYSYNYSLWVPYTNSFHPGRQNFYEFASPDYNWNFIDQILCGYYDEMPENTKFRRIRFCIIPPVLEGEQDETVYIANFHKFIEYVQSRLKVDIKISYSGMKQPSQTFKVAMTTFSDSRQEWIVLQLDSTHETSRTFQFEVKWLACSGSAIDDFISSILRKGQQYGLELRRIPEFSRTTFLQIHPLWTAIYLPAPSHCCFGVITDTLVEKFGFIFDEERITDSRGLGYGLGIEEQVRSPQSGLYQRYRMTAESMTERWRTRGYRQYMHRLHPVFLRVIHEGLIWIPSYTYGKDIGKEVRVLFEQLEIFLYSIMTVSDVIEEIVDFGQFNGVQNIGDFTLSEGTKSN